MRGSHGWPQRWQVRGSGGPAGQPLAARGPPPPPKFEAALARREEIVQTLESGNLPLDESLKVFEEGIRLARSCAKYLEGAGRKIELLTKDEAGLPKNQPFSLESGEEQGK